MEGDLSLAQSLGGLRIANPDDTPISPVSSKEAPEPRREPFFSPLSTSNVSAARNPIQDLNNLSPPSLPPNGLSRSVSPLGFDPKSFSTESVSPISPSESIGKALPQDFKPKDLSAHAQRYSNRQSIPMTYQAQQQAQFPQYPTMVPQNQRHPNQATRPVSSIYTQTPTANGHHSPKEGQYRLRTEGSQSSVSSVPQRSSSRGASHAMQAGVPVQEGNYTDRSYRQSQMYTGGRALPPRKSSRNMESGHRSNAATPGRAASSGDPYSVEGGPLKSSQEWQDKGAAIGTRRELDANGKPVLTAVKKGVKDFQFGRTLGEGSYSTVMAATDRTTGREYAMKVLDKRHIIKEKKVKYVNIEKDTLNLLNDHPGVVRLYFTFQDEHSLYYVLDLASGGELLGHLKELKTFNEECTRFYGAQILDTIDYMHAKGVIHRDLKPENVLLDHRRHVKITDFGTAKILDPTKNSPLEMNGNVPNAATSGTGVDLNRANSFVGTAEYVSPELLKDKQACKASDLWAFGCIMYQLLAGRPPFKAANEYLTFQLILALDYKFPPDFPPVARDLVERLLVHDPTRRLSLEHVKNHEFFDGIKWGKGLWGQRAPELASYKPSTADKTKSNGPTNGNNGIYPPGLPPSHSTSATRYEGTNSNVRPNPRVITELPPPSQLDIEWSPVLTRNNERILKMGNLIVNTSPTSHSPDSKNGVKSESDTPKKFWLFGNNASKKRQRLVMVTSSARIIIVASSGEEKKSKVEIPLLVSGCSWRKLQDPKGLTYWCVDTVDKHFSFEDPKSATSDGSSTSASAQEWLDSIEKARDIALSQSVANTYTGEDAFKELQPPSTSRGLDLDSPGAMDSSGSSRNTLQKPSSSDDSFMGRKRFSKRQSKSGLAAVF